MHAPRTSEDEAEESKRCTFHSKVAGSTITIFIFLTVLKLNHNLKIFKNKYELPDLIASCVFDHVASLAASRRSNE